MPWNIASVDKATPQHSVPTGWLQQSSHPPAQTIVHTELLVLLQNSQPVSQAKLRGSMLILNKVICTSQAKGMLPVFWDPNGVGDGKINWGYMYAVHEEEQCLFLKRSWDVVPPSWAWLSRGHKYMPALSGLSASNEWPVEIILYRTHK